MGLELKLHQKLSQQLVMTPQLQQAIKLLQLNHIELAELCSQEMVENPTLEEEIEQRVDPLTELAAKEAPDTSPADPNGEGQSDQTDIDWEKYLENYQSGTRTGSEVRPDFDDMPTYDQTLTRGTTLSEHLMWQLHVVDANDEVRAAAAAIVGNLNSDGYLTTPLKELAEGDQLGLETLDEALVVVQNLDPLGVGARDLRECLLVQARVLYPEDRVLLSMIDEHMGQVARQDFKTIARSLGVSFQRAGDAYRRLRLLEPKPGRPFTDDDARYITPEIYVIKSGDEYIVQLNEEGVPKLRVSNYYRQVLSGAAKGDKEYIQEKLRSAQWLIKSIYQRQQTIYKVMDAIVRRQRGFFDEGISRLKPMILRDIAEEIGMHESTVSRVTTNKYVHTPQGIFELKFFFNSGIQTSGSGGDVASETVKQRIKQIVGEENPRKPYSDQKIVKLLDGEGVKIARRTVAKYRDMLGISSSSERKRLF